MINDEKLILATATGQWWVYMIKTECGSLYTGIATDVDRRFSEHLAAYEGQPKAKAKKGAKYFRGHKPVVIVYRQRCQNRSEACVTESKIKQLNAPQKREVVNHYASAIE